ncbi:hypothetical protein [Cellulophaga sp. Z1A5H]|uniref:hypothetical protein n=1 Tax=Cellulophaga sp. Z1A5H TaxID=2687291 RepID=UPI0013FE08AF|nr:hypothetical protein [Cellulophaga sp. Z1A5H]
MSKLVRNIILAAIFLISLSSVNQWTVLPIQNTFVWWVIYIAILILALKGKIFYYDKKNDPNFYLIKIYLTWNVIAILRGFFVAEDYWEWKHLIGTSLVLLLPIITYVSSNTFLVQRIVNKWFTYVLPMFTFIWIFIAHGAYGRYLIPISFVLLFYPLLNKQWKLISLSIAIFVIAIDLGARSNVIKFLVPFAIGLTYYFRSLLVYKLLVYTRIALLIAPFILLILGITNIFNIFKMSDYIEGEYRVESSNKEWAGDGDLTVDTRTFIYVEVIASALKYDYVLFGRTPARGNESPSFGPAIDKELNRNKNERFGNEVGIANIFTWTGIVGVILNFLIFIKASYLGLKKSKNWVAKIIAIYISFRWSYSWVEDFSRFDLSTLFLWICIAICLSKSFRAMTDNEFKNWARGIFDQRYRESILKKRPVITKK